MNAVDTNVLISAVDVSEPEKSQRAGQLLRQLANDERPLVLPWQVAVEFMVCLRRWEEGGRISRQDTETYLEQVILALPMVFPTSRILSLALAMSTRYSVSHWDSLLLAACLDAGVTTLYSEDFSHQAIYDSITVVNPFQQVGDAPPR